MDLLAMMLYGDDGLSALAMIVFGFIWWGRGRSSAGLSRHTTANMQLYVDGTAGDDANNGLTALTAKKSFAGVFALINGWTIAHNITINVSGTVADADVDGYLSGLTLVNGAVVLIDGGGGVTDVVASQVSDINSTSSIGVAAAGWAVDAYAGYIVEITSGALTGQRRGIQGNSATTITPMRNFSADPGVGAEFRICRPTTTITAAGTYRGTGVKGCVGQGTIKIQRLYISGSHASVIFDDCLCLCYGAAIVSETTISGGGFWLRRVGSLCGSYPWIHDPATWVVQSATSANTQGVCLREAASCLWRNLLNLSMYGMYAQNVALTQVAFDSLGYGSRFEALQIHACGGSSSAAGGSVISNAAGYATTRFSGSADVGLKLVDCTMKVGPFTAENNGTWGIEIVGGRVEFAGVIAGTGNTTGGLYAHDGAVVTFPTASPPTLTGDGGALELSTDGSTQVSTWAAIDGGVPIDASTPGNNEHVLVKAA